MFAVKASESVVPDSDAADRPPEQPRSVRPALLWDGGDPQPWQRDMLAMFVRNQLKVIGAMPILAAILAVVFLRWVSPLVTTTWLVSALIGQALQYSLCRSFMNTDITKVRAREWIGVLTAVEFFIASVWSMPLFLFWQTGNDLQHLLLVAVLMAVIAVRIIVAANFIPILLAGTGFIAIAVAIRCAFEGTEFHLEIAAVALVVEVFLLQLSRRLQETAREMLTYKRQREDLIERLERAKHLADDAREKAEEANRAKSKFLATMSHELRTPLNAIMGFSEIMSEELMGPHSVEAYKSYASDINHSGRYLLSLINDILDLSRIEAGRQELKEEVVQLSEIAHECVRYVRAYAEEKKLTFTLDLVQNLPALYADKRLISQIWINLLSNAIKFTPEGGEITLTTRHLPHGNLFMSLKDTGPGIPASEVDSLRGAFVRGSHAVRRAIDGAGLGLSIVNGLARLHGGELQIQSTVGQGTTVAITFPAKRTLENQRADIVANLSSASASQRKLISLTA